MNMLRQLMQDMLSIRDLPTVNISLKYSEAKNNDPFFSSLVREFFADTRQRHARMPLVRQFSVGVALHALPASSDTYFAAIDASARRNVKKALRFGYEFSQIDYNEHLDDITKIRRSTEVRQGAVSAEFLAADATRCTNPASLNPTHDYRYYGVIRDGVVLAYAGCFICGEVCLLEHIYGHAAQQSDGIVPLLITGIAQHLIDECPNVRYYCYGTYFGARTSMRRFKRKFQFLPHRVTWSLD